MITVTSLEVSPGPFICLLPSDPLLGSVQPLPQLTDWFIHCSLLDYSNMLLAVYLQYPLNHPEIIQNLGNHVCRPIARQTTLSEIPHFNSCFEIPPWYQPQPMRQPSYLLFSNSGVIFILITNCSNVVDHSFTCRAINLWNPSVEKCFLLP